MVQTAEVRGLEVRAVGFVPLPQPWWLRRAAALP